MGVSDYQVGRVITTLPIETGVDSAGYDPATGDAFAANVDGTLSVVHQDSPDRYSVTQTLRRSPRSRNMGLDPANHRIYVAAAKPGPPRRADTAAPRSFPTPSGCS
jgi:DNA-binding beta-propeller fold protein YncE